MRFSSDVESHAGGGSGLETGVAQNVGLLGQPPTWPEQSSDGLTVERFRSGMAARTSTRTGAVGDGPVGGAYLDAGVRVWSRTQLPLVSMWSALWSSSQTPSAAR